VTILRPDQGVTIVLDVPHKTAKAIDLRNRPETIEVDTQLDAPPLLLANATKQRLPDVVVGGSR
jgi:hypothetical protein